jgi:hypothetical protein
MKQNKFLRENIMDESAVYSLLRQWSTNIGIGECASKEKARKSKDGLEGRIKRCVGNPVVFDLDSHCDQKAIQKKLCEELPELADVILSTPEIMDGYSWTRSDFIDLYFEHYRLVVEKIGQILAKSDAM